MEVVAGPDLRLKYVDSIGLKAGIHLDLHAIDIEAMLGVANEAEREGGAIPALGGALDLFPQRCV